MIPDKEDKVLTLLLFGIIFFTGTIFIAEHYYPMDGQLFQLLAGLLTSFGGAFFGRMKPKTDKPTPPVGTVMGTVNITADADSKA